MTLLDVQNLSVNFRTPQGDRAAVKNISFSLHAGETMAIVGESGSGKSVSVLSLLQLLPYPTAWHPSGSIMFEGQQLCGAPEPTLRRVRGNRMSMIFQEPLTALNPLHTVEQQISETLKLHQGLSETAARDKVLEILYQVNIPEPEQRLKSFPHELSGGQRQRVMIATALVNNPALLIADEPTTALDVTTQQQILSLLAKLQRERNMAMLMISHDLGLVRRVARRVAVMNNGAIVEQGFVSQIFANPQHPYTQALLNAAPKGTPTPVPDSAPILLQADDVKVHFPIKRGVLKKVVGHIKAVDGVSFTLREGETLGVVGESGSGKSTLGFGLLRLVPCMGTAVMMGRHHWLSMRGKALRMARKHVQIVFQDPFGSLSPRQTVGDIIGEGLRVHEPSLSSADRALRVADMLAHVGLTPDMVTRYPHEFSGGQRQRIAVARAIILRPKLVVLDEPTSALDLTIQSQLVDLLKKLQAQFGLSYIFISHDLRVVRAMAHQLLVLQNGKVVEQGRAEKLLSAPATPYLQTLIRDAFLG
ncbi:MAG: ABC transporter ATP-binding protein [Alphaproteobacteria bacterium]|nr:ABC transporter ATP-binding protein [Alphaproteobacteria bacterium]